LGGDKGRPTCTKLAYTPENTAQKNFLTFLSFTHRPDFREDNIKSAFWDQAVLGKNGAEKSLLRKTKPRGS
jgi:hypothetical protein